MDWMLNSGPRISPELNSSGGAARPSAEAATCAKSEPIACLSHELRTPLNAILGYTHLLIMEGGLSDRQASRLTTIQQGGQHMLALVNDILDLARIEGGRAAMNPAPMKPIAVLQAVCDLMRVKADEKQLALVFDVRPDLPEAVLCDELRLRQVMLNLLGNAIKFTDRGAVTLRACAVPAGPAQVLLRVEVEDTGIGMSSDEVLRIFEPFAQVGDARRRSEGTGLGLAITRALVGEMGGTVQVDSDTGRGTRFRVELPLTLPRTARQARQHTARVSKGGAGEAWWWTIWRRTGR